LLLQQKRWAGTAFGGKTARLFCCWQAPDRRSGCVPAEPYPPLEQNECFPVSVSLGVYRAGNGKRQFELIASGVPHDFALVGEFGQSGADGGGAHATEFAQLVQRRRFLELSQGLTHPIHRGWWRGRFDGGTFQNRECQSLARLSQLERDMVLAGRGAMLRGESQLGALAAHIEIGVTPAVEFAGTT